jgi:hypothetical protein
MDSASASGPGVIIVEDYDPAIDHVAPKINQGVHHTGIEIAVQPEDGNGPAIIIGQDLVKPNLNDNYALCAGKLLCIACVLLGGLQSPSQSFA